MRKKNGKLRTVSGLRTRYVPKSRIGQGLLSMGPWIDIVLLIIFFVFLNSSLVLQPGTIVELPRVPFREGSRSRLIAVVISVPGKSMRAGEEIVFFDDERFLVNEEAQRTKLKRAFAARLREHPDADLVIQADQHVAYGRVVEIMDMALEVGVRRVNLAARPYQP